MLRSVCESVGTSQMRFPKLPATSPSGLRFDLRVHRIQNLCFGPHVMTSGPR